jgi:hypothetical protein
MTPNPDPAPEKPGGHESVRPPRKPKRPYRTRHVVATEDAGYTPPAPRQDGGVFLPVWSIGLMLLIVFLAVVGVIGLVFTARSTTVTDATPIIRLTEISSPVARGEVLPASLFTPTLPPEVLSATTPRSALVLAGPTLATVAISPTPIAITVGRDVLVLGVGPDGLNIRDTPGVSGTTILFRGDEGERFRVVDGPLQADGFTWWRLQSAADPARTGWAASNYLAASGEE